MADLAPIYAPFVLNFQAHIPGPSRDLVIDSILNSVCGLRARSWSNLDPNIFIEIWVSFYSYWCVGYYFDSVAVFRDRGTKNSDFWTI